VTWLDAFVSKTRDRKAALTFLKELMKRHGPAEEIATNGLRSLEAALKEIGAKGRQVTGPWANHRAESSHQPFRRRARAMQRFQRLQSLQMRAAAHSSACLQFNSDRSLSSRQSYKQNRTSAPVE
jgi:putative transposase